MRKILNIFSFLIVVFASFISVFNIVNFYIWYNKKPLDIIIDIDYFIEHKFNLSQLYNFLLAANVDKVALDARYINFVPLNENFYYVFKFFHDINYKKETIQFYNGRIFSIIYLVSDTKRTLNLIKYSHYQLLKDLLFYVKLNFENYHHYKVYSFGNDKFPLRTFVCDLNLYESLKVISLKVKKAIRERSCSVIYIIPSEYLSVQENLKIISQLSKDINEKFKVCKNLTKFKSIDLKKFSNFIAFLFAVILPLFFYKRELNKIFEKTILYTYVKINFLAILLGIVTWGLLENYDYVSFNKHIYGVRLMFILPLILSFFVILNRDELKEFLNYNVKLKDFFIINLFIIVMYYLMLRMGNVSKEFILVYEIKIRELIENIILFRPRFKEIFLIQPILYISIFLIKKTGYSLPNKMFFCFGILTFSSIINTFLHVHTPLHICILRSIMGIVLGLFFGNLYIFSFKLLRIKYFS